jgi:DNA-binding MarR family transcriptional regulator
MKPKDSQQAPDGFLSGSERDFLTALRSCQSIHSVAKSTGLSPRIVAGAIRSMRLVLAVNDGPVDDFLNLVETWDADGLEGFLFPEKTSPEADPRDDYVRSIGETKGDGGAIPRDETSLKKRKIIDAIERDWSPREIHDLGASLIHLADALDQNWSAEAVQSSFHWPSAARQIERNALELAKKALLIKRQLTMRKKYLPEAMLGEPTWNMLLELFCQFAGGARVSTKSLCIAAECPESTALRHIERLEEAGLIRRFRSQMDARVTLAELTKQGVVSVGRVLERFSI